MAFSGPDVNRHQRVADDEFEGMVRAVAYLPRVEGELEALVEPWKWAMEVGWKRKDGQLTLYGDALWALPQNLLQQL